MTQIKIEKGIPVPPPRGKFLAKLPFDTMEIGDSILVKLSETEYTDIAKFRNAISVQARVCGRKLKWGFTTRAMADKKSVRVWRFK